MTHTHTAVLWLSGFCLGQPGWTGTRRNIHPVTPIVVISHPLSASSIYYCPPYDVSVNPDFSLLMFTSMQPSCLAAGNNLKGWKQTINSLTTHLSTLFSLQQFISLRVLAELHFVNDMYCKINCNCRVHYVYIWCSDTLSRAFLAPSPWGTIGNHRPHKGPITGKKLYQSYVQLCSFWHKTHIYRNP